MKIKRYVVREMQEAIRLIKQDLGPEAVIVSSYRVPAKGLAGFFMPRLLEVTAALDEAPEINLGLREHQARIAIAAGNTANVRLEPAAPAPLKLRGYGGRNLYLAGGSDHPESMAGSVPDRQAGVTIDRQEGGEERLFEKMMKTEMEAGRDKELLLKWRKILLNMDLQEDVAASLLSNFNAGLQRPGDKSGNIFTDIKKQAIRLLEPAYGPAGKARVLIFVGPTGVGKTTTLAKLATRYSMYEHKKIALVAVHTYRLGAVEQLQAYGDFLNTPVDIVMTPDELSEVVAANADKDYIFIDTAGRSVKNTGQVLELKSFLDAVKEPKEVYLVLSATTKNRDLNRIANEFLRIKFSQLIFTKIDETETHGSILNLICTLGTPVAYLTDGQSIPDCISEARPKSIVKLLFRGVDPDEVLVT